MIVHLSQRQWQLRGRRIKLINGEVDLIFKKQSEYLFVEVKYLNNSWNIFERITLAQKRKLIKNRVYYSLKFKNFSFLAAVAFVGPKNHKNKANMLNLIRLEE